MNENLSKSTSSLEEVNMSDGLKDCWGHLDTKLIKDRDCVNCLHGIAECSIESSKKEKKDIERKWC